MSPDDPAMAALSVAETAPEATHLVRRILRRPRAVACLAWLLLISIGCAFAGWIAPDQPDAQDLTHIYAGPGRAHWLGTDQLGRDIFSRILYGGRISLSVVAEGVGTYLVFGVVIGLLAGYHGGLVDRIIMRICDLLLSVPAIIVLLAELAIFSHNESAALITLGLLASAGLARVVRASTTVIRQEPYIGAATVAGLSTSQILRRHVLRQIAGPAIVQVSLVAGAALLAEVVLGFLGLGVQPPAPSWGNLVNDASQAIYRQNWLLVPTGAVIVLTALSLGLLGDTVRDVLADRASNGQPWSWRERRTVMQSTTLAPKQTAGSGNLSAGGSNAAALCVRGLSVSLPGPGRTRTKIVDQLSLQIRPGEAVGLVGESGCGKSMTIAGLLRLLPPGGIAAADSIQLAGTELVGLTERQMAAIRGRGIAYIGQEPMASLDPSFTIGAQLVESVRQHADIAKPAAVKRAVELLDAVRLREPAAVMNKYPQQLSGGMAQRVGIARALAGSPRLLLADEPTTALDVTVQAEILDLLRDLRQSTGVALLLVTHDFGVVADSCDRTIVMYAGQVVEEGSVDKIFRDPRHPYTAALLAASPQNGRRGTLLPVIPGVVPRAGRWPEGCRFADRCGAVTPDCRGQAIALTTSVDETSKYRCLHPQPVNQMGSEGVVETLA